jgi:DNA-binding MarR family transcriptional regulator/GNAT superfamily N-acetyltransferase
MAGRKARPAVGHGGAARPQAGGTTRHGGAEDGRSALGQDRPPPPGSAVEVLPDVQEVRAFNRFYTNLIGALDYRRQLYAPYTLTEARVLYELAHAPRTDAADLRGELSLDAGYLSRMLGRFEKDELVERAPSAHDPRRQSVRLTERGRTAAELLDQRSQDSVGALLSTVAEPERGRLTTAMHTIRDILTEPEPASAPAPVAAPAPAPALDRDRDRTQGTTAPSGAPGPSEADRGAGVLLRGPNPGDLGWIVQRNAALYAAEYGWDATYEALVARIVADFAGAHDPRLERVWIAELGGRPVGCVMCVRDTPDGGSEPHRGGAEPVETPGTARLRLLLVEPEARGRGVGDLLVGACVDFARSAGYDDLVLWTNDVLRAARTVYERRGFTLTAERPHHSFGADLVGQDWHLRLRAAREGGTDETRRGADGPATRPMPKS